jgi:hypothetical protein
MTNQKRPLKKRRTRWCVVLILLLVGVSWFAYFRWSVSRRLAKQIASLESQGYPVTLEQLNDWYRLPDGADNAADDYLEAFRSHVEWNAAAAKPLPIVGSGRLPEPNVPLDPNILALAQDYLKDNAEALQWLDQGAQKEHARYPVDYRIESLAQKPWLMNIRKCQRLYSLQMLVAIDQDDPEGFVRSASHGIALAGSLKQEPTLIGQLVRIACEALTRSFIARGFNRLEFTDDQLIQLANRLELTRDLNYLLRANAGEACLVLANRPDPIGLSRPDPMGQSGWSGFVMTPYRLLGLMDRDLCEYLELLQIRLNPESSTVQALFEAGQIAESRYQAIPKSHFMLRNLLPAMERTTQLYGRYYAGFVTTRTAIVVLRYRLKYQNLPENLALLVPEFMSVVPGDPLDGEPIRYIKQANGFIVYSVGEDGQDNGGRDRDPKDRKKPFDLVCSVQGLK